MQAALAEKLVVVDQRLKELADFRSELAALIEQAAELSSHEASAQVCSIVEESIPLPTNPVSMPTFSHKSRKRRKSAIN